MKKILLLIILVITLNSFSQSGFLPGNYYVKPYTIMTTHTFDFNTYYDTDSVGNKYVYEIWKYAQWYRVNGKYDYFKWEYNYSYNYNEWILYSGNGTYYYYQWVKYKRYFYYFNGIKKYSN
jgi:hypothetical protein